ncbi:GNAT family N-acetyltransferase [Roseburia inulinivorans]|jgi:RimJ/RimL family protein N-acetyltransferase|uniref:GNAT family N-acetyltransferase n=1 Tax=Roseburia inulinivorans TaxID=360807 RepID=UPI0026732B00|nr:GNAT family N-acetyltransferase [Roseburia inulinivorans]
MSVYLKEAGRKDLDLLFQWVNEPSVRKNSFSTNVVSYEEHIEWYNKILCDKNCKQYIYMDEDIPVGQARIVCKENVVEINYSICAEKRSMGYGKKLLQLISRQAWIDFPHAKKIIGRVKSENIASQKAFIDAGYKEDYYIYELLKESKGEQR